MSNEELIKVGLAEGLKLLGLVSFLFYQMRRYGQRLSGIETQLTELKVNSAVMARDIKHAIDIKEFVHADHDALISLAELVKRNTKDVNATHSLIRELKEA